MTARISDLAIRHAQPRPKKYKLACGRGLVLLVMPDGAKYWRLRYRFRGKQKELSVGRPYPETSLKAAELEASRLMLQLADGVDPAEQRRAKKASPAAVLFKNAADSWYEHRKRLWATRTSTQVRDYLEKDLIPKLGAIELDRITTRDLAKLCNSIADRGAVDVAKKTQQWLAGIFSYARASGWTTNDPVRDVKALVVLVGSKRNHAHVEPQELASLVRRIRTVDASSFVKGATLLSLWTANRPGVTRTLRWSELNLDEGIWSIEKGRDEMKRGYAHITPLPRQAVELLRELRAVSGQLEYAFPGRNDPRKPLSDGAVNQFLKRIGYRGKQTAHGFRHVVSTALNELGYEADWVERQLAHGDPDKIRGTYNKALYLEQRRQMMQAWADHLDSFE